MRGNGRDLPFAGTGDDELIGGRQADRLLGGRGNDVFIFESRFDSATGGSNRDVVGDFERGADRIDLGGAGGDSFIATAAFTGAAGQIRYDSTRAGHSVVSVDVDGDSNADMEIVLRNVAVLDSEDFIL